MAHRKITDRVVREAPIPIEADQAIVRDTSLQGFALRVTRSGHRSFIVNYTCNGLQRRMTIGSPPAWSVAAARERAKAIRRQVDAGIDPLEEKQRARAEPTMFFVWDRYRAEVLSTRSAKTQANVSSIWKRIVLPAIGRKRIANVAQSDVERLHRETSEQTPTQSNRMLASMQHVFNKSIQWKLTDHNPVKGVERNPEVRRVRYLSPKELETFLEELRRPPITPSSLALEFLLLTGARSGETFKAKWNEFDLDASIWSKPPKNTKSKKAHRIPLSPQAMSILEKAKKLAVGHYVFPGKSGAHLTTVKTRFTRVCKNAGITNFRVHDLRHSYASMLAMDGVPLLTIGHLLGHSQLSTTARYAHLDDASMRLATKMVGEKVRSHGK